VEPRDRAVGAAAREAITHENSINTMGRNVRGTD
jgi:hypothetical protein